MKAHAYCNHGRWIADCPDPLCGNAIQLEPRQVTYHCRGGCNLVAEVVWPSDVDEITEVLDQRPNKVNRNWAPAGHRQSITSHVPMGQTVADLIAETREHEVAQ